MKIKALVKSVALGALCTLPMSAQANSVTECKVTEVWAFSDRVHVKCDGSIYYAVPTSPSAEAARFTTMASLAVGDYLWIEYDWFDHSGQSFGCQVHDCRRALSWRLK